MFRSSSIGTRVLVIIFGSHSPLTLVFSTVLMKPVILEFASRLPFCISESSKDFKLTPFFVTPSNFSKLLCFNDTRVFSGVRSLSRSFHVNCFHVEHTARVDGAFMACFHFSYANRLSVYIYTFFPVGNAFEQAYTMNISTIPLKHIKKYSVQASNVVKKILTKKITTDVTINK